MQQIKLCVCVPQELRDRARDLRINFSECTRKALMKEIESSEVKVND